MAQELQQGPDEILTRENDVLDEHDLDEIIQSVREAEYFDAASMAPLTPASVVSLL